MKEEYKSPMYIIQLLPIYWDRKGKNNKKHQKQKQKNKNQKNITNKNTNNKCIQLRYNK